MKKENNKKRKKKTLNDKEKKISIFCLPFVL